MAFTILWDNDGTLVDTEHLFQQASREALAGLGIDLTRELYIEYCLVQGHSTFDLARERGQSEEAIQRQHAAREARYAELVRAEGPHALPGVEAMLAGLHGQVGMAIVTGARRSQFELIHASGGLLEYMEFSITYDDYERAKPDPDPYRTALARGGLRPEECVVVEDSARGLASAVAAGLRCLVVPNELTRGGDFSAAALVLDTIEEAAEAALRLA